MAILVLGNDKTKAVPVLDSGGSTPVVSPLNVTPSTSAQQFIPSAGTDGYNPVNVAAVTNSIDANITSDNIVNGVTILGVTGTAPKRIAGVRSIDQNGTYSVVRSDNTFLSSLHVDVVPSGVINITNNGIYDVGNYGTADVNVAGGSAPSYNFMYNDITNLAYGSDIYGPTLETSLSNLRMLSIYIFGDISNRSLCIQAIDNNDDTYSFEEFLIGAGVSYEYCYYNNLDSYIVQQNDQLTCTIVYGNPGTDSWVSFDLELTVGQ